MSIKSLKYEPQDGVEVILDGSKYYWQTRTNLDILIAVHSTSCLELVLYDSDKLMEFPRIYLNYEIVAAKIDKSELQKRYGAKKEPFLRQKKDFNPKELEQQVLGGMISDYILNRIFMLRDSDIVQSPENNNSPISLKPKSNCETVTNDENGSVRLDSVCEKPEQITPLLVQRSGKKSSANEFNSVMTQLRDDAAALNRACDSASRLAGLAKSSVSGFQDMIAKRNMILTRCSVPRRRWVKAIRRVLINNYITAVRCRLDAAAAAASASSAPTECSDEWEEEKSSRSSHGFSSSSSSSKINSAKVSVAPPSPAVLTKSASSNSASTTILHRTNSESYDENRRNANKNSSNSSYGVLPALMASHSLDTAVSNAASPQKKNTSHRGEARASVGGEGEKGGASGANFTADTKPGSTRGSKTPRGPAAAQASATTRSTNVVLDSDEDAHSQGINNHSSTSSSSSSSSLALPVLSHHNSSSFSSSTKLFHQRVPSPVPFEGQHDVISRDEYERAAVAGPPPSNSSLHNAINNDVAVTDSRQQQHNRHHHLSYPQVVSDFSFPFESTYIHDHILSEKRTSTAVAGVDISLLHSSESHMSTQSPRSQLAQAQTQQAMQAHSHYQLHHQHQRPMKSDGTSTLSVGPVGVGSGFGVPDTKILSIPTHGKSKASSSSSLPLYHHTTAAMSGAAAYGSVGKVGFGVGGSDGMMGFGAVSGNDPARRRASIGTVSDSDEEQSSAWLANTRRKLHPDSYSASSSSSSSLLPVQHTASVDSLHGDTHTRGRGEPTRQHSTNNAYGRVATPVITSFAPPLKYSPPEGVQHITKQQLQQARRAIFSRGGGDFELSETDYDADEDSLGALEMSTSFDEGTIVSIATHTSNWGTAASTAAGVAVASINGKTSTGAGANGLQQHSKTRKNSSGSRHPKSGSTNPQQHHHQHHHQHRRRRSDDSGASFSTIDTLDQHPTGVIASSRLCTGDPLAGGLGGSGSGKTTLPHHQHPQGNKRGSSAITRTPRGSATPRTIKAPTAIAGSASGSSGNIIRSTRATAVIAPLLPSTSCSSGSSAAAGVAGGVASKGGKGIASGGFTGAGGGGRVRRSTTTALLAPIPPGNSVDHLVGGYRPQPQPLQTHIHAR